MSVADHAQPIAPPSVAVRGGAPGRAVRAGLTLVVSLALVVFGQAPVEADEPPADDEVTSFTAVPISIDGSGVIVGTLTPSTPVLAQCTPVESGSPLCMGGGPALSTPIEIQGAGQFFTRSALVQSSLGWLEREARDFVSAVHQLPNDGRVRSHARPEMRAFVFHRMLDILDKAAWGQPLSDDESRALAYLQGSIIDSRRVVTGFAVEEYQRWRNQDCDYTPPNAPSFVAEPLTLSREYVQACQARSANRTAGQTTLGAAAPSVGAFQTWASYRQGRETMTALESPLVAGQMTMGMRAVVGVGGLALAVASGALAGVVVGASASMSFAVASAMGSAAVFSTWSAAFAPTMAAAVSGIAATGIGAVVVAALMLVLVTVMASLHFVQRDQVGAELEKQSAQARASADPFKLAEMRVKYAGSDFREGMGDDPPYHRLPDSGVADELWQLVTIDTMTTTSGGPVVDPTEMWPDDGLPEGDFRFRMAGSSTPVDEITLVDGPNAQRKLAFERFWMVQTEGGVARPALGFVYQDAVDGHHKYAMRLPVTTESDFGWLVSEVAADGNRTTGVPAEFIRVYTPQGPKQVAVVAPAADFGGMYPAVAGIRMPGRTLALRPNPVDSDGNFDPNAFRQAPHAYAWTIRRIADDGTETVAGSATGFDATWSPTQPGRYRAQVVKTPVANGVSTASVEFVVDAPTIDDVGIELSDDGIDLAVQVNATERAASDTFTVHVTWPRDPAGDPVTSTVTGIACQPTGPEGCTLGMTGPQQVALKHTPHRLARLEDSVLVRIENSFGEQVERELFLSSDNRPRVLAPDEQYLDQHTAPQAEAVSVVANTSHVQVPFGAPSNSLVAMVKTSVGQEPFLMFHDAHAPQPDVWRSPHSMTGHVMALDADEQFFLGAHPTDVPGLWQLVVWTYGADVSTLGVHRFRVPMYDGKGYRVLELVVESVPAENDQYRAWVGVDQDAVPDHIPSFVPELLGGKDGGPAYTGDYCVRMSSMQGHGTEQICTPYRRLPVQDGVRRLPLADLFPSGLTGDYRLEVWLEGEGGSSLPTGFRTFDFDTDGPPVLGAHNWDQRALTMRVSVTAAVGTSIVRTECWLDGTALADCVPTGGGKVKLGNIPVGAHQLRVLVTDSTGNYARRDYAFNRVLQVAKLKIRTVKTVKRTAKRVKVTISGLAPGEKYVVRIAGKKVAKGVAGQQGKVTRKVRLPKKLKQALVAVKVRGATSTRVGQTKLKVRR